MRTLHDMPVVQRQTLRGRIRASHFPLVRLLTGSVKYKCVDGTANCYLAATAIIAAGLSGIEKKAKLEMHGLTGLASLLSEEERREAKVSRRLPLNIEEGRKALVEDGVMEETFGAEVIQTYLSVNRVSNFTFLFCVFFSDKNI